MADKFYITYLAVNLTVKEVLDFLKLFAELESTSWTISCITWSETSPRLATIALHVEKEQDFLLRASFDAGLLYHHGWYKKFRMQREPTPVDMITNAKFRQSIGRN